MFFFVGFAIKVPMFPFHTWLPDAHVEAPTAISVILAGVLLKLGTYGMLRINFGVLPFTTEWASLGMGIFGAVGIVYAALVCMAQKDLKKLIHHVDDGVVAAVFTAYGTWKSDGAMREMLGFFTRYPDEKSFATGSISVDTGSAGTEDAEAAKAKWKSKYGGQRGWRPRPECTKALLAALKEITGFGFRRPEDLEEYLKNLSFMKNFTLLRALKQKKEDY